MGIEGRRRGGGYRGEEEERGEVGIDGRRRGGGYRGEEEEGRWA